MTDKTLAEDIAEFMGLMAREMNNNQHKGNKTDWINVDPKILLADVLYHAGKLAVAIKSQDDAKVEEHAADVANLAMMTLQAYRTAGYSSISSRDSDFRNRDSDCGRDDDYDDFRVSLS